MRTMRTIQRWRARRRDRKAMARHGAMVAVLSAARTPDPGDAP